MVDRIRPFEEGLNLIHMPGKCRNYEAIEVLLTVDAKSSMGDGIEYLKAELKAIVGRIEKKRSDLSGLPNGTYWIVANVGDEKLTGRVLLRR